MIKVDEFVHRILKAEAAKRGVSLKKLIEEFAIQLEKESKCLYTQK